MLIFIETILAISLQDTQCKSLISIIYLIDLTQSFCVINWSAVE